VLAGCAAFLSIDLALFSASLTKVTGGGWLPLTVAFGVFAIMTTWRRGHERLMLNRSEQEGPLRPFVEDVRAGRPPVRRAPETAVFLHSNRDTTPLALRANVKFNHTLHETVVIVLLETLNTPHVAAAARVSVDELGYRDDGITHVTIRLGFQDRHDVPAALALAATRLHERTIDVERALYFLSRITIVPTSAPDLRRWRKRLFIAMWRNQADPTRYFGLPDERTAIMGSLIEL
jgi:KUP system potassium uptake protein